MPQAQCLPTALLIQKNFGGEVLVTPNGGPRESHYANRVFGSHIDLVDDHAHDGHFVPVDDPSVFEWNSRVATALAVLERRWCKTIHQALPCEEIEFVAVVPESQLAHGYLRPDVDLVVLHGAHRRSISDERFFPGQNVWIKLRGGDIISRSKLEQWTVVSCRDTRTESLEKLCRGFVGPRAERIWQDVHRSSRGHIAVLRLTPDENLPVPISPGTTARLRPLVPLDTWSKKIVWLHSGHCDLNLPRDRSWLERPVSPEAGRYRFKWEHLLDVDISIALDTRMKRGDRFQGRIKALNRMAGLFLATTEDAMDAMIDQFSDGDLELLEDVLDFVITGEDRDVRETVTTLGHEIRLLHDSDFVGPSDAAQLSRLAGVVDAMSLIERATLIDALYRPTAEAF